jgi:hypothetical protein
MVDDTQNYLGFGLLPSSGILGNRGHDVSKTGSVSVFRWERKTPTQLGPLERDNLNPVSESINRLAFVEDTWCVYCEVRTEFLYNIKKNWVFKAQQCLELISTQWLRLALSKGPNWVGVFLSHLKTETDPVSETSCPLLPKIPEDGKSPKPQ